MCLHVSVSCGFMKGNPFPIGSIPLRQGVCGLSGENSKMDSGMGVENIKMSVDKLLNNLQKVKKIRKKINKIKKINKNLTEIAKINNTIDELKKTIEITNPLYEPISSFFLPDDVVEGPAFESGCPPSPTYEPTSPYQPLM